MNKRNLKNTIEKKQGITLIALVVTIIVLLILAGISITMLTGQNSILDKANIATIESGIGNVAESMNLYLSNKLIDSTLNGDDKSSMTILKENNIIDGDNIIDVEKIMGTKVKLGNGKNGKDVYKIDGDKLVYIDSSGQTVSERNISISKSDFETLWVVNANDTIVLPIAYAGNNGCASDNNFTVDWGDGSQKEKISGVISERPSHTYTNAGEYIITISGKCSYFTFDSLEGGNDTITKLKKIIKWGEIGARKYNFAGATNLEGNIPAPTSNTFTNVADDIFEYLFENCVNIESISKDLFKYIPENITSFEGTFSHCEKLKKIPANLFENASDAITFKETFYKCYELEEIPEGLFKNSINATNFRKTFYECSKVKSIPNEIFDNIPNITNLNATFYNLNQITSVPKLWERTTESLNGTSCFAGCTSVDTSSIAPEIVEVWFK